MEEDQWLGGENSIQCRQGNLDQGSPPSYPDVPYVVLHPPGLLGKTRLRQPLDRFGGGVGRTRREWLGWLGPIFVGLNSKVDLGFVILELLI